MHEIWALKLGTRLEIRPRYTPPTCFETFPFPFTDDLIRTEDDPAHIVAKFRAAHYHTEQSNVLREDPPPTTPGDDDILARLLALNLKRAATELVPVIKPLKKEARGQRREANSDGGNQVSAEEQSSGDLIAALGKTGKERGATVAVSPACHEWQAAADDRDIAAKIEVRIPSPPSSAL